MAGMECSEGNGWLFSMGSSGQRSDGVWAETGHGHAKVFPRCTEGLKVFTLPSVDRRGRALGLYRGFGDERDVTLVGVPACTDELGMG